MRVVPAFRGNAPIYPEHFPSGHKTDRSLLLHGLQQFFRSLTEQCFEAGERDLIRCHAGVRIPV